MSTNDSGWRLPAEWEAQDATLIAWPHAGTDWRGDLDAVEACYVRLAVAITRRQRLLIVVPDEDLRQRVRTRLVAAGADPDRLHFVLHVLDDTWCRDIGPLTLLDEQGRALLLDFHFTGWGGKFAAARDDALVARLVDSGLFPAAAHQRIEFALEGGAIESDGAGTVLSTWRCLRQRHPQRSDAEIDRQLRAALRAQRIVWLEHGYIEGDDTDGHVDTLARLAPGGTLVYQGCDDPADSHYDELGAMARELQQLRQSDGRPYRLLALPWPRPIHDADGRRLAASYANYLIVNGAVLMPSYGDSVDAEAAAVVAAAHPDRELVPIDCRALIRQNGSLHCACMQIPHGVLDG